MPATPTPAQEAAAEFVLRYRRPSAVDFLLPVAGVAFTAWLFWHDPSPWVRVGAIGVALVVAVLWVRAELEALRDQSVQVLLSRTGIWTKKLGYHSFDDAYVQLEQSPRASSKTLIIREQASGQKLDELELNHYAFDAGPLWKLLDELLARGAELARR